MENLAKHEKVSKYYENDCLQKIFWLFMSILTAPIVKKQPCFRWNLLYLSKKTLSENKLESLLKPNFERGEKIRKAVRK